MATMDTPVHLPSMSTPTITERVPLNEVAGVTCTTQPASPARYTASTVPSPPVYFTSSYPSAGSTSAMAACLVFSAFASM